MPDYKYLIVGGGITSDAAVKGIRQIDSSGTIGIISTEKYPPYNRPLLSKGLWKGEPLEKVWRDTPKENVEIHLSRLAKNIDPQKKYVVDDRGVTYSFDKLLLATGGAVRRLPYAAEGIIYFRTLEDYHHLRALTERGEKFAIIGGGFIGAEIAAALAMNNKSVTMIFPEEGIGARVYPSAVSQFLNTFYQSKNVEVLSKQSVVNIEKQNSLYVITTQSGLKIAVDGVVAGIGIQPNVELAQTAALAVDNGIVVDEFLVTSHFDIYSAGDVANYFSPILGKSVRVEHEDNANMMGEIAGKNMAGSKTAYNYLPSFYSDMFELGYEAVGELDSRFEIIEQWKEQFREGIIYYLCEGRIRGVLLWNTWGQVEAAKNLISEKSLLNAQNVIGRLPV